MKKILAIILVLALALCFFAACGSDVDNGDNSSNVPETTPTIKEDTTPETEETTAPETEEPAAPETKETAAPETEEPAASETEETTAPEETYPEIPNATDDVKDDVGEDIFG